MDLVSSTRIMLRRGVSLGFTVPRVWRALATWSLPSPATPRRPQGALGALKTVGGPMQRSSGVWGMRWASSSTPSHSSPAAMASKSSFAQYRELFKEHGVIPDVVEDFQPCGDLTVQYGPEAVLGGNVLTPRMVKDPPHVHYPHEEGCLYTVILTDPDAPSRANPKFREWRHWTVVNVPGCDVSRGEEICEYIGSLPPQGTSLHRYVFLVYKQPHRLDMRGVTKLQNTSGAGRGGWKARDFAKSYGLELVMCNFFRAEWDTYVPEGYAKFK